MSVRRGTWANRLSGKSLRETRQLLPETRQPSTCMNSLWELRSGHRNQNVLLFLIDPPTGLKSWNIRNRINKYLLKHSPWLSSVLFAPLMATSRRLDNEG